MTEEDMCRAVQSEGVAGIRQEEGSVGRTIEKALVLHTGVVTWPCPAPFIQSVARERRERELSGLKAKGVR